MAPRSYEVYEVDHARLHQLYIHSLLSTAYSISVASPRSCACVMICYFYRTAISEWYTHLLHMPYLCSSMEVYPPTHKLQRATLCCISLESKGQPHSNNQFNLWTNDHCLITCTGRTYNGGCRKYRHCGSAEEVRRPALASGFVIAYTSVSRMLRLRLNVSMIRLTSRRPRRGSIPPYR